MAKIIGLAEATTDRVTTSAGTGVFDTASGQIKFLQLVNKITTATSDGTDNAFLHICGGGDASTARGGLIGLGGNESGSAGGVSIQSGGSGYIDFYNNGSQCIKIINGNLEFVTSTFNIKADTSDGSDNKRISISGGGSDAASRGSYIALFGNDHASAAGTVELYGGDATTNGNGHVAIGTRSTVGQIRFLTNSSLRWIVNPNGHFEPQNNNSYDIGTSSSAQIRTIYARDLRITGDNLNNSVIITTSVAGSSTLRWDTFNDPAQTANNKNWAFRNRYNDYGLFELMRSTTSTGDPLTTVMSWDKDGTCRATGTFILTGTGSLIFAGSGLSRVIRTDTSDGSDNKIISIVAGGDLGDSRGAQVLLDGNEATNTGRLLLSCGNVGGGTLQLRTFGTQDIYMMTNNTNRWVIGGGAGHLVPQADNTYNIGSVNFDVSAVFTRQLYTSGANFLTISTNGTARWYVGSDGHLSGANNNGYDVGTSSSQVRNVYLGALVFGSSNTINRVTCNNGGNNQYLYLCSALNEDVNRGSQIRLAGNSASGSEAAGSLGIYSGNVSTGYITLRTFGAANIDFYTSQTQRWVIDGSNGILYPGANNTYDVGTPSFRVRTFYAVNALNTSDQRIKQDILSLNSQTTLDKICALNPVSFKLVPEYDDSDRVRAGFLAQEVITHIPEAVVAGDLDPAKEYGDEGFESWSMQTDHLIPYLVGAIKKLKEEIDTLKSRVDALENP